MFRGWAEGVRRLERERPGTNVGRVGDMGAGAAVYLSGRVVRMPKTDRDIVVSSWEELQRALFEGAWDDKLHRYRSPYLFRGAPDLGFKLHPSLTRLGAHYPSVERHILRNFSKYAYNERALHVSVWNQLALAQHHGLPTRLLDWTYSPYVALHFATEDHARFHQDGAIWMVNYLEARERHLPPPLRDALKWEGSYIFTAELLDRFARSLEALEALEWPLAEGEAAAGVGDVRGAPDAGGGGTGRPEPFPIFLEPPSLDDRIVNQFAVFSLMSSHAVLFQDWLEGHPSLYRRIVIPAEGKWEVRDKLDQVNITERVLFPGLDGLARWLRRTYSAGPGTGQRGTRWRAGVLGMRGADGV